MIVIAVSSAYASQNGHGNSNNNNGSNQGSLHGNGSVNGNSDTHTNKNNSEPDDTTLQNEIVTTISPTSIITPTPKTDSGKTGTPLQDPIATVSPTITIIPCDPNLNWKNHGAYVSCIAHLHDGGKAVSEAAKSDIGKKNEQETTPTPILSITPSVSPSPITSALPTISGGASPLSNLGAIFGKFLKFLQHLL